MNNLKQTLKKEENIKKIMKKTILALFCLIFLLNTAFSEDVCRYIEGQTIFRCNDALPNIVITPGQEQNLTIYCCLTGDAYNNTDTYNGNIRIVFNESFGNQYVENGIRITETNLVFYNASKWISAYYLPENITGFEAFPVTISYNAPLFSSEYDSGVVISSRFDISLNIPGKMIPQLAILPNVMLPADYKPLDYKLYIYTISGIIIIFTLIAITFKNDKINQKVKRFFRKQKKHEEKHEIIKEEKNDEGERKNE